MEELSQQLGGMSISKMEINESMLENVMELMKSQKLETMTVEQLLQHFCDIKLKNEGAASPAKSQPPDNTVDSTPSTPETPCFTFKTPSKIFSPNLLGKQIIDVDDDEDKTGLTASRQLFDGPFCGGDEKRNEEGTKAIPTVEPSVNFDIGLVDNVSKKGKTPRKHLSRAAVRPEKPQNSAGVGGESFGLFWGQPANSSPISSATNIPSFVSESSNSAKVASFVFGASSGNLSTEEENRPPEKKNQEVPPSVIKGKVMRPSTPGSGDNGVVNGSTSSTAVPTQTPAKVTSSFGVAAASAAFSASFSFHSGIKPSTHRKRRSPKKSNYLSSKLSTNSSAFGGAATPPAKSVGDSDVCPGTGGWTIFNDEPPSWWKGPNPPKSQEQKVEEKLEKEEERKQEESDDGDDVDCEMNSDISDASDEDSGNLESKRTSGVEMEADDCEEDEDEDDNNENNSSFDSPEYENIYPKDSFVSQVNVTANEANRGNKSSESASRSVPIAAAESTKFGMPNTAPSLPKAFPPPPPSPPQEGPSTSSHPLAPPFPPPPSVFPGGQSAAQTPSKVPSFSIGSTAKPVRKLSNRLATAFTQKAEDSQAAETSFRPPPPPPPPPSFESPKTPPPPEPHRMNKPPPPPVAPQMPKSQPFVPPPPPPPPVSTHASQEPDFDDSQISYDKDRTTANIAASKMATAEFYRKQGKEFYSVSEDYEKSLECFTKCLESAPDNWSSRPVVLGNRAAVLFMLERFVESAADCKQAVDEDASLRKLNIRRGKSLLRLGQLDEAEETLSELLNDVSVDEDSRVEARSLLGTVSSMKLKVTQLSTAELSGTHSVVMSKADEILQQCPAHRAALLSKVRTSCAMKNWAAAKTFIDENILNLPESTLRMSCHPLAEFPAPSARDLSIDVKKTAAKTNTRLSAAAVGTVQQLQINIPAIVRALLCLGSPMAKLYVCLLKNVDANRACCADVMEKVLQVLNELNDVVSLSVMDRTDANNYNWVPAEIARVNAIITSKNQADLHFRKEEFKLAAAGYAATLKLDTEAIRWSSILHSNKAAALMSLGNYSEAVVECHEAIAGDANNPKPYLRRARAYASLKQYTNSVRDYRTYLVSDPPPPDLNEIQIEYEGVLKDQKKQLHENTARHEAAGADRRKSFQGFKQQSSTSSSFESGRRDSMGGGTSTRSNAQFRRNSTASSQSRHSMDSDDDEAFFEFFQGKGAYGAWGTAPPPPPPRSTYASYNHTGSSKASGGKTAGNGSSSSYSQPGGRSSSQSSNRNKVSSDEENSLPDHYACLGVEITASDREIRMAYRKLALQFHPDKNKNDGAEEKFKQVTGAYSVLSDKVERAKYDRTRPVSTHRRY